MTKQSAKYKLVNAGLIISLIILLFPSFLFAGSVSLSWSKPSSNIDGTYLTDLAGFKIHYGTVPGVYTNKINIGNVTNYQLNNLSAGATYYITVTAYDFTGNESGFSNEISKTLGTITPNVPEITVTDSVAPVSDLNIPFGNITVGNSTAQTVTIKNDGNANLLVSSITGTNKVSAPFSLSNDQCSGQAVAPSSNCTFTVIYFPSAVGVFGDSFDIVSNDSDESSIRFNLTGTGSAVPVANITVIDSVYPQSDFLVPFGDITEGNSSVKTVTVRSDGSADLLIGSIAQIYPLSAPFSIINDSCSYRTVSPGNICRFYVKFYPVSAGSYIDTFDIPSNDPDSSSVVVTARGTGLPSVSNNLPSTPMPFYPANDQIDLGTSVEFRWEKSSDPDGDSITYDLYVCEDSNLTTGCISKLNVAAIAGTVVYYAGTGSYGISFILLSIAVFGISGVIDKQKLRVTIAAAAMTGILLISCGGGGGDGSGSVSEAPASEGSGEVQSTYTDNEVVQTVTGLKTGTIYYWKVVARDSSGGERSSNVWSFDTK